MAGSQSLIKSFFDEGNCGFVLKQVSLSSSLFLILFFSLTRLLASARAFRAAAKEASNRAGDCMRGADEMVAQWH